MNSHFLSRNCCPCCKSTINAILYEKGFTEYPIKEYLECFYSPQGGVEFEFLKNAHFVLIECNACGLIYQKEIGNGFLMSKLYEQWIDPIRAFALIDERLNMEYFMELAKQVGNVLWYFDTKPSRLRFLDFGMGWGHWCRLANGFGCEVYGSELSQARIDYARRTGIRVISWEEIPNYQFDFINTEQIFEHIADPLETLVYLKNVLKPRGIIRISVPDGSDIKKRLRIGDWAAPKGSANCLNAVAPLEHINCFNHDVVVDLACRTGLKMTEIPDKFASSLKERVKSILRPYYYSMKRRRETSLYFRNSPTD